MRIVESIHKRYRTMYISAIRPRRYIHFVICSCEIVNKGSNHFKRGKDLKSAR